MMNPLSLSSNCVRTTIDSDDAGSCHHDGHEESSWTMYFEDFFANNNKSDDCEYSSFSYDDYGSSSLVSDAASLVAAKKSTNNNDDDKKLGGLPFDHRSYSPRLSFRKRRTRGVLQEVDDALEDTASSPVNSPKVYELMNQFKKNSKQKQHTAFPQIQEKGSTSLSNNQQEQEVEVQQQKVDERSDDHELDFIEKESVSTELKKRGLCVVPLSLVVTYLR